MSATALAGLASATPAFSRSGAVAPTGTERILLVEDEPLVRSLVVAQLRGLGYTVIEAANGSEGLDALAAHGAVDLMITDLTLPGGFDGVHLSGEVMRLHPATRILIVSGKLVEESTFARGTVATLAKPFRKIELAQAVRACLDAPASARENAPAAGAAGASSKGPCGI